MRESIGAVAIISREGPNGTEWLARWNSNWNSYGLVGGHKRDSESFRECIVREIHEELGLTEDRGVCIAPEPVADLHYTAWSERAKAETAYTLEVFHVDLQDIAFLGEILENMNCRWLTASEIRGRSCKDGTSISSTIQLVLEKIGQEDFSASS